ncbi:MAG TPA: hypothetical protein PLZ74_10750, partial [Kiritimatiellia bacterium]|nr:hypothetical protein [Kiritimatiellia bacterium]
PRRCHPPHALLPLQLPAVEGGGRQVLQSAASLDPTNPPDLTDPPLRAGTPALPTPDAGFLRKRIWLGGA